MGLKCHVPALGSVPSAQCIWWLLGSSWSYADQDQMPTEAASKMPCYFDANEVDPRITTRWRLPTARVEGHCALHMC